MPASSPADGLPFWLFYVLVCAILLLLAFIFLRNRDLRFKMNMFFSGARRRMQAARLKTKIKREKEKRRLLFIEVGKKAWLEHLEVKGTEQEYRALAGLEDKLAGLQKEWQESFARLENLNRRRETEAHDFLIKLEDLYKEQTPLKEQIKDVRNRRKELVQAIRGAEKEMQAERARAGLRGEELKNEDHQPELFPGHYDHDQDKQARPALPEHLAGMESSVIELRERRAGMERSLAGLKTALASVNENIQKVETERRQALNNTDKEIQDATQVKESIQKTILLTRRRLEPFWEAVGKALENNRLPREDLYIYYIQFDEMERKLRELKEELEEIS